MNTFVDTAMLILFILFMIFIFAGYHKNKSSQREDAFAKDEETPKESSSKIF